METDPRHIRLREISAELGQHAAQDRALETERNRILRELAAEHGRGKLTRLGELAGLTRGRIHQILREEEERC